MHPLQAGEKQGRAHARVVDAATELSKRLNLSPLLATALTVQQRDPMVKRIVETEAIADLLDAVLASLPVDSPEKEK